MKSNGDNCIALELKDLCYSRDGIPVLEDVNLQVEEKDFLGIIGPNGGGKTTLLKVILGLLKADCGNVSVFGESLHKNRELIGYVPQYANFDRSYPINVWETVIMGRLGKRRGRKYLPADKEAVNEALQKVEISSLKNRQIGQLSGGERQRVLVARALVGEPRILLLDEPTASTDSRFEASFYELLEELNKEMTIILISHDISAVSTYVRTLACLNRRLYYNKSRVLTAEMIEQTYHCPVDLIAHGVPHRVLAPHDGVVG